MLERLLINLGSPRHYMKNVYLKLLTVVLVCIVLYLPTFSRWENL